MSSGLPKPIAWTEGMLLRPQHLQHHDLYLDGRLHYHLSALSPFHWGLRELELNRDALSDHRLEVLRLDMVLPGGAIVRYPGNAQVEGREFSPEVERLAVHAALRRMSPSDPNAVAGEAGASARYRIRSEELPDLQRGGGETPVDLLEPVVRLLVTGEEDQLESCESLKLAEVEATGELKTPFRVSPAYYPPLLVVQACPVLEEEVAKIVAQIAAKVRVVAGRTETHAVSDLRRMWMRYTLARMTPTLRHLLSTGATPPYALYTALVETAGALAAFAAPDPPELPLYDHADLRGCFGALLEFLDAHLQEALPDRFTELPLEFEAERKAYTTDALSVELTDPRNQYYLGIKADLDSQELAKLVEEHGKLSSIKGVTMLVMLNRGGLRTEKLPAAPTEIASRAGFDYFKVEPHGEQWDRVRSEFSFGVSLGKLEAADARLYVVAHEG